MSWSPQRALATVGALAAAVALGACGDGGGFLPASGSAVAPPAARVPTVRIPAAARRPGAHLIAVLPQSEVLYREPGRFPLVRLPRRTQWGSPEVLSVVRRHGPWLGVIAPELGNGRFGWVHALRVRLGVVDWELHVDLSRRRIQVLRGGRPVRSFAIAVGGPGHPTPRGRFAVTDKLRVTSSSSPYGCCVVALTARQPHTPQAWSGGDRIAIHATTALWSVGQAVSLGCMRAYPADARFLMRRLPLGTPVFVRG